MYNYNYNILELIHPVETEDLIRLGRNRDGGYVVNNSAIVCADLISFGINDDWSFEESYLNYTKNSVAMYDASISISKFRSDFTNSWLEFFSLRFFYSLFRIPGSFKRQLKSFKNARHTYKSFKRFCSNPKVSFYRNFISNINSGNFITIKDIFEKKNSSIKYFLKIDIEGHEYRIIEDLCNRHDIISGLTVEFHDIDLMYNIFELQIESLKTHFYITHIHANNYSIVNHKLGTPTVWEISFINKKLITGSPKLVQKKEYPLSTLDFANQQDNIDFRFFYP